mmetsp:Transcript_66191/g.178916  ORF Transcript_66191/g.178916 Transcript_66191/m.178916 type:complete len:462 (+) Transcript_66191:48-1433(+)
MSAACSAEHAVRRAAMREDGAEEGPGHSAEGQLLGVAPAEPGIPWRSCGRRATPAAGFAAVMVLLALASSRVFSRPMAHSPKPVSLVSVGVGIVNVDVTLNGLPYSNLSANTDARNALEDVVARMFAGKMPKCNVFVQVVDHNVFDDSTVLQVTLVPTSGENSTRVAQYIQSESGIRSMSLLLEDAMSSMTILADIATGAVTLHSLKEAGQDGHLQHTVADVTQGSSAIPMGATTIGKGDVITIGPEGREELTVVSHNNGSLEVRPPLSRSYPTGTIVIRIPPRFEEEIASETTSAPASPSDDAEADIASEPASAATPAPSDVAELSDGPTSAPTPAPTSAPAPAAPAPPAGDAEVQQPPAPGRGGHVTQSVTISNLPRDQLDARSRAVVESQIREAYADALDLSPSQVAATVKADDGRRLRWSAASGERAGDTELRAAVEVAQGQSEAGLQSRVVGSREW